MEAMRQNVLAAALVAAVLLGPAAAQRRRPGSASGAESAPPIAHSETERRILDTIDGIVKAGDLYANVPTADGRLIRILTEAIGAKAAVEIGSSTGISGLWFALALNKTGGRLTTFELDKNRAALARKHFQQAGVDGFVSLVEGDAHRTIATLRAPIDIVFIDAEKEGYADYLNQLLPLVRPGGLILAHNTDMVPEYMRAVAANPALDTVVYANGGGLAVTLKKR